MTNFELNSTQEEDLRVMADFSTGVSAQCSTVANQMPYSSQKSREMEELSCQAKQSWERELESSLCNRGLDEGRVFVVPSSTRTGHIK